MGQFMEALTRELDLVKTAAISVYGSNTEVEDLRNSLVTIIQTYAASQQSV